MISKHFLLQVLLLFVCLTPLEYVELNWFYSDHPDEEQIEIGYKNDTSRSICLSPTDWPNEAGKVNEPQGAIAVSVDGKRFPMTDFNSGYCFGNDCTRRVSPGETILARMWYRDFNLPKIYWTHKKVLEFRAVGWICK